MRVFSTFSVMAVAGLAGILACSKAKPPEPPALPPPPPAPVVFKVTGVDLGKSIAPDKAISAPTAVFAPHDTIFASVASEGVASNATIRTRFTFGSGQLVNETSQTIAPNGPAHTEFHIWKKSGWPVGRYKVEVFVDSASVAAKDFEVKKG